MTGELWCADWTTWRAEELGARHFWPIDLPREVPSEVAVWVPGQTAAQWRHEAGDGAPVLRSLGRDWPAHVPGGLDVTPRKVLTWSGALRGLWTEPMFVKLADAKDERFPAKVRTRGETVRDLREAGGFTELIVAPVREYVREVRVFYSTRGASASVYREVSGGRERFYDGGEVLSPGDFAVPEGFAPGTVWDFGQSPQGRWEVIEYNAAWSSAWYGCDLGVVRQALRDARDSDMPLWSPDAITVRGVRKC